MKATKNTPKQSATDKPQTKPGQSGARRIDGSGHIDPAHAARLKKIAAETKDRGEDSAAFVQDHTTADDLAEELGEEAVLAMTSGQDDIPDERDAQVDEENGGPFIETSGNTEFAGGTDESNIEEATREPFPKT